MTTAKYIILAILSAFNFWGALAMLIPMIVLGYVGRAFSPAPGLIGYLPKININVGTVLWAMVLSFALLGTI